jgi:ArsR family transcriptional regulator, arsenate/arsenite/antimonite-responsive transcriptional repressor
MSDRGTVKKSVSAETAIGTAGAIVLDERQMHAIARAISDPRRFQIMQEVAAQTCSSCTHLRESQPVTAATLSHHIKELDQAGLVATSKQGKFVNLQFRREVWNAYLARLSRI